MTFQGYPYLQKSSKKRYQELPASGRPSQSHTSSLLALACRFVGFLFSRGRRSFLLRAVLPNAVGGEPATLISPPSDLIKNSNTLYSGLDAAIAAGYHSARCIHQSPKGSPQESPGLLPRDPTTGAEAPKYCDNGLAAHSDHSEQWNFPGNNGSVPLLCWQ